MSRIMLQSVRRAKGYKTAQSLADATGISREIIAQIEAGRQQRINTDQLIALCKACGCAPYDLIPELPAPHDAPSVSKSITENLKAIQILIAQLEK